jgi:hypothetical protein
MVESHEPEKTSFADDIPQNKVGVLGARCDSSPSIVESECSNSPLVTVEGGYDRLGSYVPKSDRPVCIADRKSTPFG